MVDTCNVTFFKETDWLADIYENIFNFISLKIEQGFTYSIENFIHLIAVIVIYFILNILFFIFLTKKNTFLKYSAMNNVKNALFVISHPDDEAMFFGPTILSLTSRSDVNVHILCLSRGNNAGLGRLRKEEFWSSCKILGIDENNIMMVNSTLLPDDPKIKWGMETVANLVLNIIEQYTIDTVITFDNGGVSNHINHKSVFYGLAYLILEKQLPKNCVVYALESVSLARKYTWCIDIILSYFLSSIIYITSGPSRLQIIKAMKAHETQYVWFRKLYMLASRYTYINSLRKVDLLDLDLEIDFSLDDELN